MRHRTYRKITFIDVFQFNTLQKLTYFTRKQSISFIRANNSILHWEVGHSVEESYHNTSSGKSLSLAFTVYWVFAFMVVAYGCGNLIVEFSVVY